MLLHMNRYFLTTTTSKKNPNKLGINVNNTGCLVDLLKLLLKHF